MCSGHLRQEFQELELLDHITTLLYEKRLPDSVCGDHRYTLIESFQSVFGSDFVPDTVESSVR
ncbi:hypothetical protein EV421DRAFT_1719296 [Armillaria borealis]|uniref:Uncharacterized protein n=1 Tax=Armillaria borealis TaxID=47425 RepID=A0AA39IYC2_9AGAR|nr:hypothetical protein EV421DRAFT_1719296 [Armillaria borealis]